MVIRPDHPVLELLRTRLDTGSRPGARTDGAKLGLAVEGGGMRGVVSGAMLCALEELHLIRCFDAVYGCSSGAVNAAYALAGDTWFPLSIYYDDLPTREFMDYRRVLRGRSALSSGFVFDTLMEGRKPLRYDRVLASEVPLHVAITDVDTVSTISATGFASAEELRAALVASTWLPVAMFGTTRWRGHRAVDGGVLTAHPFRLALWDECTHVLSLSTRPAGSLRTAPASPHRAVAGWLEVLSRGLGTGYLAAMRDYLGNDRPMLDGWRAEPEARPAVLDLAPAADAIPLGRDERDRIRLLDAARSAYQLVYGLVGGADVDVVLRLVGVPRAAGPAASDGTSGAPDGPAANGRRTDGPDPSGMVSAGRGAP